MSKNSLRGVFGGALLKNSHAKSARPLSGTSYMQIVMKMRKTLSSSTLKNPRAVLLKTAKDLGQKHRVQIKEFSWHRRQLQLTVKLSRKKRYAPFIRALSGAIALQISGANKFKALKESFWLHRPWTCILAVSKQTYYLKKMLLQQLSSIDSGSLSTIRTRARGP